MKLLNWTQFVSVLVLIFGFSFQANAVGETTADQVKNCVEFIRGSQEIAPYFPVDGDGRVDREALQKLVTDKKASYLLKDGQEIIKTTNGGQEVTLTVNRKSGRLETITSETTQSTVYGNPYYSSGGYIPYIGYLGNNTQLGMPLYPGMVPNATAMIWHKKTFRFKHQDGTCIPESQYDTHSMTDSMNPQNRSSVTSQDFNIDSCRKLALFFDKNPSMLACADQKVALSLKGIMEEVPKATFEGGPFRQLTNLQRLPMPPNFMPNNKGMAGTPPPPSVDKSEMGSVWYSARTAYDKCRSTPGVHSAMRDEALWKDKAAAGGTGSKITQ